MSDEVETDEVIGSTDYPDGTRAEYTETKVRILDRLGNLLRERAPMPEEVQRILKLLEERETQKREEQVSTELWQAAVDAYNRNNAFIAAAATATYPLPVEQQEYLVATVADIASTVNGILRLLDNKGLLS